MADKLEVVFREASIVDGTGAPAYVGDVGVQAGRLVTACAGYPALREVDAAGKTLCPGFIDSHSHMDHMLGQPDAVAALCKVSQGITTEITGQCGESEFPAEETNAFFTRMQRLPMVGNYAFLCGHSALRQHIMGMDSAAPSAVQMARMKAALVRAMENGCLGMSSGLIYTPGVYAAADELAELCGAIKPYGGIYATHMRSEGDHVLAAVAEAIAVAREAGVALVISHHKIVGRQNWGLSGKTLQMVHAAIASGLRVTLDLYPYEASQTTLSTSIPPEYFTQGYEHFAAQLRDPQVRAAIRARMVSDTPGYNCGYRNTGGFEGIVVVSAPGMPQAEGMSVARFASQNGVDPFDAYFDILAACGGQGGACYFCIDPAEMERIYLDENTVVGSDSVLYGATGPVHPRAYGALVRSLSLFSLQRKLLPFEQAVYKQTLLTAQRWGLQGKGRIAQGWDADLVLLNKATLTDTATYAQPRQLAKGIEQVYVRGALAYAEGQLTGAHPGRCVLRGKNREGCGL